MKPILILFITLIGLNFACKAQIPPIQHEEYPFIQYDANILHYDSTSPTLQHAFRKWRNIVATKQGNLNIVHIGSSHVQAGTLTNTTRCNILLAFPGLTSSRGMLFPYSAAANCNNPTDYRIHCPQRVSLTRNVYKEYPSPLGLCGIAITTTDTLTEIQVALNEPRIDYSTSRIVIIGHSDSSIIPLIHIQGRNIFPSYVDPNTDRFIYNLQHPVDSFAIILRCPTNQSFTLTGLFLGNQHPGISYHSIGVNGASTSDYLRCTHFTRDLRLLHPDIIVFGIGINDAVPSTFDTAQFRSNYLQLIDSVRSVNPNCAFIFLTNNDSYIKKSRNKYLVNRNGLLARDVFYRLAHDTQGAVWDQFEIMGGLESMDKWRKKGLAQTDRVHFTNAGYQLIANLFSQALLSAAFPNNKPSNSDRYQFISY